MFRIHFEKDERGHYTQTFHGIEIDKYQTDFNKLYEAYDLISLRNEDARNIYPLKHKKDRKCRFCNKKSGEVTFKKIAHLVPEALGNKRMRSDFECDQCNEHFGIYEDQFCKFLGISRTIGRVKGKNGIPKYKSPDHKLIIRPGDMPVPNKNAGVIIESNVEKNEHFIFDQANSKFIIRAPRQPYTPFQVYKAILKIGLSLIPDEATIDYDDAFHLLLGKAKEMKENPFYRVNLYVHPGPSYPSPLVLLLKKKSPNMNVPTHIFCLLFQNHMYQMYLPYNQKDMWMYDGRQEILFLKVPPFIDKHFALKYGTPMEHCLNLSSMKVISGEVQELTLSYDTAEFNEALKHGVKVDK